MYCNRIIGVTEFAMWTANLWVNAVLTQKQQEKFLKLLRVTVRVVGYRFNAKTTFSSHRAHNVVNGTRLDTGSRRPTTVDVIYCTLKCLLSEKLEKKYKLFSFVFVLCSLAPTPWAYFYSFFSTDKCVVHTRARAYNIITSLVKRLKVAVT